MCFFRPDVHKPPLIRFMEKYSLTRDYDSCGVPAAMKVICAGFPKTGTKSLALALAQLGYTVADFPEQMEEVDTYLAVLQGRLATEALRALLSEVDVVVDQPACHLWAPLLHLFPEAKVVQGRGRVAR